MKLRKLSIAVLAALPMVATVGCSTAPKTTSGQQELDMDASRKLQQAMAMDPSLRDTLDRSAGYAVFPTAGRGGLVVGGGYGKGALYEHGRITGYCDMSQAGAGAMIGGKEFSEIIVFQRPEEVAKFKNGQFQFSANASAVALNQGAAANAQFKDNVIVFVFDQEGLMADASLNGQSFRFTPLGEARQAAAAVEGSQSGQHQVNTSATYGNTSQDTRGSTQGGVDVNTQSNPPRVDVHSNP